jgi:hypothetical protein
MVALIGWMLCLEVLITWVQIMFNSAITRLRAEFTAIKQILKNEKGIYEGFLL